MAGRFYRFTPRFELPLHWNDGGMVDGHLHNLLAWKIEDVLTPLAGLTWHDPVADVGSLPPMGNDPGDARVVLSEMEIYLWNGTMWVRESEGALIYMGVWDASTNTPFLSDATGVRGHYYVVGVQGTQDLGSGPITFHPGDWAVHNATVWQKADHTDQVTSVFGRQGAVVAAAGDYAASQITDDSSWPGPFIDSTLNSLFAHRARHISGGADAFLSTDILEAIVKRIQESGGPTTLSIGSIADGQILQRVGSSVVGFTEVKERNQQEAVAQVTGTVAWTTLHGWTTSVLPAGTYKIYWSYEWGYSVTNRFMYRRIQANGTTVRGPLATQKALAYPNTEEASGFGYIVLASPAAVTVNLDVQPSNATDTASIIRSRFEIEKV